MSTNLGENDYLVEWRIDVSATSPEVAALEAQEAFKSGNCPFFVVIDKEGNEILINVDEL